MGVEGRLIHRPLASEVPLDSVFHKIILKILPIFNKCTKCCKRKRQQEEVESPSRRGSRRVSRRGSSDKSDSRRGSQDLANFPPRSGSKDASDRPPEEPVTEQAPKA